MTSTPDTRQTKKSDIKKVEAACNMCGSTDSSLVTTGVEHEYENTTDDRFNVVRCTACGLVYLNPRPDVSELSTIYPPDYYSYSQQKLREEANPRSLLHYLRYKGFRAKIRKSLSLCPGRQLVCVLDIGCGDGHTLNLYRDVARDIAGEVARDGAGDKAGFAVETHGVDFNAEAVAAASRQGHDAHAGRFEDVDFAPDSFDLVVASHVIEHVADPVGFARKVHHVLRPGGVFWFETPNIGCLDARLFRRHHWGAYHFPRHWFFFDTASIRRLADLTGFEVVSIDFVPNAVFWFWTFHSLIVSNHPKLRGLADRLFPPVDFQKDTLANFLRICFFCGIDVLVKLVTGETSNMVIAFRKR